MSIDARVRTVIHNEDGSGELLLEDRPPRWPGDTPGVAGQRCLHFDSAPHEITALNGLDVWGGADTLMLGERRIARRVGYGGLEFVGGEEFKGAVGEYRRRRGHDREP